MISFIFMISIIFLILLVFALVSQEYTIGVLSAMGFLLVGVYILIYGMDTLKNLITLAYGLVCIGLGAYVMLQGTMEKVQEVM